VQIGSACLKSEIQKSMVTSFAKMADDTFCWVFALSKHCQPCIIFVGLVLTVWLGFKPRRQIVCRRQKKTLAYYTAASTTEGKVYEFTNGPNTQQCLFLVSFFSLISGLYYKHMTIVNDGSRVDNKLEASLTDNARVIIYDRHMFIAQATDLCR
jgi:hypothetical protein